MSWEKLNIPDISGVPCFTEVNKEGVTGDFTSVKPKRKETLQRQDTEVEGSSESSSSETEKEETSVRIFSCPEEGCLKR